MVVVVVVLVVAALAVAVEEVVDGWYLPGVDSPPLADISSWKLSLHNPEEGP